VLPKDFGSPNLDKIALGRLISLVRDIALGSAADRAKDTLGRAYDPQARHVTPFGFTDVQQLPDREDLAVLDHP
jgi:hypothetical protein